MARLLLGVAFVLAGLAAGCTEHGGRPGTDGGGTGSDGSVPAGTLRIEPADMVANIDGAPVVIPYHAFIDATEVTTAVMWSSTVAELGGFSGNTFTSVTTRGGRTTIRATMGSLVATTSLTLRLSATVIDPSAPADAPTRFASATADPAVAPEIVYPSDGVMVPPNLRDLEIHYRGRGATLFELRLQTPGSDLRIYLGCPEIVADGCVYTPDRTTWEILATAARGTGAFVWGLRGIDAAGRLGDAGTRTMSIAQEDITGGLYYWNAGGGTIERFEFAVPGAVAERFLGAPEAGALTCVGCHALSRDGRRIAIGTDIPTTTFQVFDVATRTRVFSQGGGGGIGSFPSQPNFSAFNPDASELVSSSAMGLTIRDGTSGNVTAGPFGGGPSEMPDWSPDGDHIVYVRHDAPVIGGFLYDFSSVQGGRIETLVRSGMTWVAGPELAAGGGNNYYPAYSPDGRWVLFNRSPSNTPSMGMDASGSMSAYVADAQMWIVPSDGSSPPVLLGHAGGLADAWPKWDPTLYLDQGRDLFWFAWSSRRGYGLRYADLGGPVQIWMAAFDPSRTSDPSYAAFRLPYQDITTGNHIPQWVTHVERMTCTTDAQCGGEFCVDGRCYDQPPLF